MLKFDFAYLGASGLSDNYTIDRAEKIKRAGIAAMWMWGSRRSPPGIPRVLTAAVIRTQPQRGDKSLRRGRGGHGARSYSKVASSDRHGLGRCE